MWLNYRAYNSTTSFILITLLTNRNNLQKVIIKTKK